MSQAEPSTPHPLKNESHIFPLKVDSQISGIKTWPNKSLHHLVFFLLANHKLQKSAKLQSETVKTNHYTFQQKSNLSHLPRDKVTDVRFLFYFFT